jgi:hypothetical protein
VDDDDVVLSHHILDRELQIRHSFQQRLRISLEIVASPPDAV